MKEVSCPEPLELMIWLDQEDKQPALIAEHVQHCTHCQSLVEELRSENLNLSGCLESITYPDFTSKVMIRIMTTTSEPKLFYNVLWYILLVMTTLSATLAYYFAVPFLTADSWAVAGAKIYAASISLYFTASNIGRYFLNEVISGKPLLPAFSLAAAILLFHLLSKRRYSNA